MNAEQKQIMYSIYQNNIQMCLMLGLMYLNLRYFYFYLSKHF